jgi:nucleotide-binding universal stress UspA family protein
MALADWGVAIGVAFTVLLLEETRKLAVRTFGSLHRTWEIANALQRAQSFWRPVRRPRRHADLGGRCRSTVRADRIEEKAMKIVFAADGSACTKEALAFLVTHENLAGADGELFVLNVQAPLPPTVALMMSSEAANASHRDEANKVLDPIKLILDRHQIPYRCDWTVGSPAAEIVSAIMREKAQMIVMGTHGHGVLGRIVMGSVAQRVVADCDVPVLLVK